jgi:hypothetical protein
MEQPEHTESEHGPGSAQSQNTPTTCAGNPTGRPKQCRTNQRTGGELAPSREAAPKQISRHRSKSSTGGEEPRPVRRCQDPSRDRRPRCCCNAQAAAAGFDDVKNRRRNERGCAFMRTGKKDRAEQEASDPSRRAGRPSRACAAEGTIARSRSPPTERQNGTIPSSLLQTGPTEISIFSLFGFSLL